MFDGELCICAVPLPTHRTDVSLVPAVDSQTKQDNSNHLSSRKVCLRFCHHRYPSLVNVPYSLVYYYTLNKQIHHMLTAPAAHGKSPPARQNPQPSVIRPRQGSAPGGQTSAYRSRTSREV